MYCVGCPKNENEKFKQKKARLLLRYPRYMVTILNRRFATKEFYREIPNLFGFSKHVLHNKQ